MHNRPRPSALPEIAENVQKENVHIAHVCIPTFKFTSWSTKTTKLSDLGSIACSALVQVYLSKYDSLSSQFCKTRYILWWQNWSVWAPRLTSKMDVQTMIPECWKMGTTRDVPSNSLMPPGSVYWGVSKRSLGLPSPSRQPWCLCLQRYISLYLHSRAWVRYLDVQIRQLKQYSLSNLSPYYPSCILSSATSDLPIQWFRWSRLLSIFGIPWLNKLAKLAI